MLKAARALLSVYDKRGLPELAQGLVGLGVELLSTGGTYRELEAAGIPVLPVSEVTGFPEILGGRVKTLHPRIHGGILADRGQAAHVSSLRDHGIPPIDVVVANLYPFRETAADEGASVEQIIEMIDIGGPAMVRGAAKNYRGVVVVVDPADYPQVLAALEEGDGRVPETLRRRLAIKAFRHTQAYDAAVAAWLERVSGDEPGQFRRHLLLDLEKVAEPRYGENPHQQGVLYRLLGGAGVFEGFEQLGGKELSFNNLLDADAARTLVARIDEPAAAIIKHNNPCGVGRGDSVREAYERALACDPKSAFGSVVALNRPAGAGLAKAMAGEFVEVVVAPEFDEEGLRLQRKKKSRRLIRCPVFRPARGDLELRQVDGGMLVQTPDHEWDDPGGWQQVSARQPEPGERAALEFAWQVVRQVRSNAIVVANAAQTVGIGAGQMSRVDACHLAVGKAELPTAGCAAASDAFFPFRDGLDVLADAGVTALVQPGGSKRDAELIAAADERRLAMLFTGRRHFRH
jgi:phosphoribosylaminoimidazolecarboxamide formyltransferase/IMP cyclohydrolase